MAPFCCPSIFLCSSTLESHRSATKPALSVTQGVAEIGVGPHRYEACFLERVSGQVENLLPIGCLQDVNDVLNDVRSSLQQSSEESVGYSITCARSRASFLRFPIVCTL